MNIYRMMKTPVALSVYPMHYSVVRKLLPDNIRMEHSKLDTSLLKVSAKEKQQNVLILILPSRLL